MPKIGGIKCQCTSKLYHKWIFVSQITLTAKVLKAFVIGNAQRSRDAIVDNGLVTV